MAPQPPRPPTGIRIRPDDIPFDIGTARHGQHVAAADGKTATDPPAASGDEQAASADQLAEELYGRLERAMYEYGALLQAAAAEDMDDATFSKRALRIGLIVRDSDAWLLDLSSGRWFRYDGITLSQVGAATAPGAAHEDGG